MNPRLGQNDQYHSRNKTRESYPGSIQPVANVVPDSSTTPRKGAAIRTYASHAVIKGSFSAMTNSKDHRITCRLTRNESELIRWAALNSNMNISEFMRSAALDRAGQVLVAVNTEKESA